MCIFTGTRITRSAAAMQRQEYLNRIDELIDQQLDKPDFSADQLYRQLGMSRSLAAQLIKEHTGLSPSLYIRKRRMQKACQLLSTTDWRMVSIADAVGLDSPQTFTKYFTQEYGLSPSEYRRQRVLPEPVEEIPAPVAAGEADAQEQPARWSGTRRRWALAGVMLLAVLTAGLYLSLRQVQAEDASVAVLPFAFQGNASDSLLADGLYDQVYASLASVEQLHVTSKVSSGYFRGPHNNLLEISHKLRVEHLLMGRVVSYTRKLRVSVELIRPRDNRVIWARTFEGDLAQGMSFMNSIARQVTGELDRKLNTDESRRLDRLPTRNLPAFNEYLRGEQLLKSRNADKMQTAIGYFDRALALDSTFADALASKGQAYFLLGSDGHLELLRGMRLAEQNALQAIRIDEDNGLAYAILGNCYWRLSKPEQALTTYEIALRHRPNDALIHYWYSLALRSVGRFDEAIRSGNRALELDPLYPTIIVGHVGNFTAAGRFAEAWRLIEESKPLLDGFFMYYYVRAFYYLYQQDYRQALREFIKTDSLYPDNLQIRAYQLYCRARLGERAPAEAMLQELTDVPDHYVYKAILSAGLLDRERCLHYLELGAPLSIAPEYLKISPLYKFLHGNPRFETVLRQLGLSGSA